MAIKVFANFVRSNYWLAFSLSGPSHMSYLWVSLTIATFEVYLSIERGN